MGFSYRTKIRISLAVLFLQIGLIPTQFALSQELSPQPGRGPMTGQRSGFMQMKADPRIQMLIFAGINRGFSLMHAD